MANLRLPDGISYTELGRWWLTDPEVPNDTPQNPGPSPVYSRPVNGPDGIKELVERKLESLGAVNDDGEQFDPDPPQPDHIHIAEDHDSKNSHMIKPHRIDDPSLSYLDADLNYLSNPAIPLENRRQALLGMYLIKRCR